MTEKLGRFGHHPDPAIDFEVEVESIIAMNINRNTEFDDEPELENRVGNAMNFTVGGVESCVVAKNELREIAKSLGV